MPVVIHLDDAAVEQPGADRLTDRLRADVTAHLHNASLDSACSITIRLRELDVRSSGLSRSARATLDLETKVGVKTMEHTLRYAPSILATKFATLEELQSYRSARTDEQASRRFASMPRVELPEEVVQGVVSMVCEYIDENIDDPDDSNLGRWKLLGVLMWIGVVVALTVSFGVMYSVSGDIGVSAISAPLCAVPWLGILYATRAIVMPSRFFDHSATGRAVKNRIMESATSKGLKAICAAVIVGMLAVLVVLWATMIGSLPAH